MILVTQKSFSLSYIICLLFMDYKVYCCQICWKTNFFFKCGNLSNSTQVGSCCRIFRISIFNHTFYPIQLPNMGIILMQKRGTVCQYPQVEALRNPIKTDTTKQPTLSVRTVMLVRFYCSSISQKHKCRF